MAHYKVGLLPGRFQNAQIRALGALIHDLEDARDMAKTLMDGDAYRMPHARAIWIAMLTVYHRCFAGGPRQHHLPAREVFDEERLVVHELLRGIRDDLNHPGFGWAEAYATVTVRCDPGVQQSIAGGPAIGGSYVTHSAAADAPAVHELAEIALDYARAKLKAEFDEMRPRLDGLTQREIDSLDLPPPPNFPTRPR